MSHLSAAAVHRFAWEKEVLAAKQRVERFSVVEIAGPQLSRLGARLVYDDALSFSEFLSIK